MSVLDRCFQPPHGDGMKTADVAEPTRGARDVLVDVRAASINGLNKMVRNGEFKQLLEYERAFVLGHEAERTGR